MIVILFIFVSRMGSQSEPVFFMAAHAGLGLMESAMPFLERGASIFLYRWNPHAEEIRDYFALNYSDKVRTFDMTLDSLIREIAAEEREIVMLMTASPAYEFGAAQQRLFKILQQRFYSKIVDVYKVGHCMYGCTSHSHDDACNFPVSYSRFFRKTLPYDSDTVTAKYFAGSSDSNSALNVFVCPSYSWNDKTYAKTSLLSNLSSIEVLKELHQDGADVCVKFHPICYAYTHLASEVEAEGSSHPFLSVPPQDEAGLRRLMQTLPTVPAHETSALPFFQTCDVAVCDLFSSMTFEALYFHPKIHVFAFAGEEIPQFTPDPQIKMLVHIFHDGHELKRLLKLAESGELERRNLPDGSNGRDFFKDKYQEPDGMEVENVGRIRRWPGFIEASAKRDIVNGDLRDVLAEELLVEYRQSIRFPSKLQSMVTGQTLSEIELELASDPLRCFVEDHRPQLRSMSLPKSLWHRLFLKLRDEIFDAGERFQIQMETDEDGNHLGYRVSALARMDADEDVFLVDHAMTWTEEAEAFEVLRANPILLQRIESLVGIEICEESAAASRVERLMKTLSREAESYMARGSGINQQKINFLNDEFGSKIRKIADDDDEGQARNVNLEAFYYVYQRIAFSVFWPRKRIEQDEEIFR